MTKKQIKWASKHDWYIGTIDGDVIALNREYNNETDTLIEEIVTFEDFETMYYWAGY